MAEPSHTTAQIRENFAWFERDAASKRIAEEVFDRWLAAHDAEIHAAGVAEGIRQAREAASRIAIRRGHGLDHSIRYSAAEVKAACYDIATEIDALETT